MKSLKTFAAGLLLIATQHVFAGPIAGYSDVIDLGGGAYKFVFDTLPGPDIDGTGDGLFFSNGTGLDLLVTALPPAPGFTVRQDVPAHGGLGVLSPTPGTTDNLESALEGLALLFNQTVEVTAISFNGMIGMSGHQEEADGAILVNGFLLDASEHDEFGDPDLAVSFLSDLHVIGGGPSTFEGYLESITVQTTVPAPSALMLLGLGLLGLSAVRRNK